MAEMRPIELDCPRCNGTIYVPVKATLRQHEVRIGDTGLPFVYVDVTPGKAYPHTCDTEGGQ